ncbi:putative pentatricopeptide repeat-containing protein At1g03510 [Mangifera indica]|uniref:putative pentatricopeptide repeat-containing protein At1g03510 n=1 Tax=Mangifera indica TaxID=29780 RepID=UPI001CFB1889|nr:putative pentatricopeptide repeat-containing protein At1g03510 [Mangifera indica]
MSYSSNYLRLLSFTKQLSSYVSKGLHDQALSLFRHIQASLALTLDPFVFPLVLKSCGAIGRPQLCTAIHSHVTKSSLLNNTFVSCALVDAYGKCVSIYWARQLFDEIPLRNVVVWNVMISLYAHNGYVMDALKLFQVMDVAPDEATFNSIIAGLAKLEEGSFKAIVFYRKMQEWGLKRSLITLLALLPACLGVATLSLIKEIHGYAIRNYIESNTQLRSGLVEAYGRCGSLDCAQIVFNSIKDRDVVAWSSLISAYAIHGQARTALEIFRQMEKAEVWPDHITFLAVLKACSHAGLADEALDYFSRMSKDYGMQATSDHYSCLVDVLSRAGRLYDAYEVIREMPVEVTARAWGALLGACQTYGELELAEIAGRALVEIEPENPSNYIPLARIYTNLGRHEDAQRMWREMKKRGVKAAPGSSWVV